MPAQPPLVLTVAEAALALQVSEASIRAAIRRGDLPTFRLGKRVLLPRAGLKKILATAEKAFTAQDPARPKFQGGGGAYGTARGQQIAATTPRFKLVFFSVVILTVGLFAAAMWVSYFPPATGGDDLRKNFLEYGKLGFVAMLGLLGGRAL